MPTEKEIGQRIEDFMGVNTLVASDDLKNEFFLETKNLYERNLGELTRRGGSENLTDISQLLTNSYTKDYIQDVDSAAILYDANIGKEKIFQVFHDPLQNPIGSGSATITEAGITAAFETDVSGKWGVTGVGIPSAFIGCNGIQLVAYGFGMFHRLNTELTTGLPISGDTKRLKISRTGAITKPIQMILVYARYTYAYIGGSPYYTWVQVGTIDLLNDSGPFWYFNHGPIHLPSDPGIPQEVGNLGSSFTLSSASSTGVTSVRRKLKAGITYYVAVIPQHLKFTDATVPYVETDNFSIWQGANVATIVLAEDQRIDVNVTVAGSASSMILIGTHPQAMMPIGIVSNNAAYIYQINELPAHGITARAELTGTGVYKWLFRTANISAYQSYAVYETRGSGTSIYGFTGHWRRIPINDPPFGLNFGKDENYARMSESLTLPSWGVGSGSPWPNEKNSIWNHTNALFNGKEVVFGVSKPVVPTNPASFVRDNYPNLVFSDGFASARLIPEFGCLSPKPMKAIANYKTALVGIDDNFVYFTQPDYQNNWSVPGAGSTLQFVKVQSSGEKLEGVGLYTNTSGTSGPIQQLLISKLQSLFLLTDLPIYTGSSNNNVSCLQLSGKVGALHRCIVNTEVGTIIASPYGVYLVREDGEPSPIGEQIKFFLNPEDPSIVLNTSYWGAVIHDDLVKLAFNNTGGSLPNKELWLDLKKMKALQGQSCWYGPMTGRQIKHSIVEKPFGTIERSKRIGVCDSTNLSVTKYLSELDNVLIQSDWNNAFEISMTTKDFRLGEPNSNKIYTRTLWMLKVDADITFTETTSVLVPEGVETEVQQMVVPKLPTHTGGTFTTFLAARQKLYEIFPVLRLRGEAIRKTLSYTGTAFFAISGFTIHYRQEGRRVS